MSQFSENTTPDNAFERVFNWPQNPEEATTLDNAFERVFGTTQRT